MKTNGKALVLIGVRIWSNTKYGIRPKIQQQNAIPLWHHHTKESPKEKEKKHIFDSDNRMLVRRLINCLQQERQNHRIVVNELKQIIINEERHKIATIFLKEMHTILTDIDTRKKHSIGFDDDCIEILQIDHHFSHNSKMLFVFEIHVLIDPN